jgi:hypothetical protein
MAFSLAWGIAGISNRAEKVAVCGAWPVLNGEGLSVEKRVKAGNAKLLGHERTESRACKGHVKGPS